MNNKHQPAAIYMEGHLNSDYGKMGVGVMRYGDYPVRCVIDSAHRGRRVCDACDLPFDYPVVGDVAAAARRGAKVLILGTAPSGGALPPEWHAPLRESLQLGMSVINGLHDNLNARFGHLLSPGQSIWDARRPTFTPRIAAARAAKLTNKRVLFVGTDMAVGKLTAALEIHNWLRAHNHNAAFIATGQIGIVIAGRGIPLDAFRVDHACGAVEKVVVDAAQNSIVLIEGQGSLLHPGSSATLSLMRGGCATHLIMCHRARATHLRAPNAIKIPPLGEFIKLNESVARACGALTAAKTVGVALNTFGLSDAQARDEINALEDDVQLPVADVVRDNAGKLAELLITDD